MEFNLVNARQNDEKAAGSGIVNNWVSKNFSFFKKFLYFNRIFKLHSEALDLRFCKFLFDSFVVKISIGYSMFKILWQNFFQLKLWVWWEKYDRVVIDIPNKFFSWIIGISIWILKFPIIFLPECLAESRN